MTYTRQDIVQLVDALVCDVYNNARYGDDMLAPIESRERLMQAIDSLVGDWEQESNHEK